jgi:hypothetical protein
VLTHPKYLCHSVFVANPIHLDLDGAKPIHTPAPAPKPAEAERKNCRNSVFFTPSQQRRFDAARRKLGLSGPALLSMIFTEYADREGL